MKAIILAVCSALALLVAGNASTATLAGNPGSSHVTFASSAAAHDPSSGVPSFDVSPGSTLTFDYPDADGSGGSTVTERSPQKSRSFASVFMDGEFTITHWRYFPYPFKVNMFQWDHYFSWAGNGSCITARYQNSEWSNFVHHGWHFDGPTSYVVNHIDACNAWFAGRQGEYTWEAINPLIHRYPWHVGIGYAWGSWRTYDWDNPGN